MSEIAETTRALAELSPHELNYNQHPADQVERLKASLVAFGQVRPIVIRGDGTILAGHGVYMAARELGYATLRCSVVPDNWTPERALAYLVADNETRRGSDPDNEALARLIDETRHEVGLEALGFDAAALDALLAEVANVDTLDPADAFGALPNGDRAPFQQMTFTLSDEQAERVKAAIDTAKDAGPFDATGNENSNGNALARIAEAYLG